MGYPKRENGCYICPGGPIAIIVTHGENDNVVTLDSGQTTATCYASTDGCGDGATASTPAPCELVDGCPAATPVKRCFIPNQDHGLWAGAMTQAWTFFKTLP
jgi:poly(3-hydroxybutyrate) depolymerase